MKDYSKTLEIENPAAVCGGCHFTTELAGEWTVEDGRLVFRAAADPQPRRGPDLQSCCESDHDGVGVVEFEHVTAGREQLSDEQVAELRATARAAAERQMAEWEAEERARES